MLVNLQQNINQGSQLLTETLDLSGAEGRTRTDMLSPTLDFESIPLYTSCQM